MERMQCLAQLPEGVQQQAQRQGGGRPLSLPQGDKESSLGRVQDAESRLEHFLQLQRSSLSAHRVTAEKSLSKGEWRSATGLVHITIQKGGHWQIHGHCHQQQLYLLAEEAVFLMEKGALEVVSCSENVPITLQEAYHSLIGHMPLEQYLVYAWLKRAGYVVKRTLLNESGKTVASCPLCEPQPPTPSEAILEVHQEPGSYRKTRPQPPDYRITVARPSEEFPTAAQLERLASLQPQAPVEVCVLDGASLAFYSLTPATIITTPPV